MICLACGPCVGGLCLAADFVILQSWVIRRDFKDKAVDSLESTLITDLDDDAVASFKADGFIKRVEFQS